MSTLDFSLTELNKPKDWDNLITMAKKHVPIITAPNKVKAGEGFKVKLKVGGVDGVEHPNMLGHWINWITLYAGERIIVKIYFYPELTNGYEAELNITLNETSNLRVQSYCNLHGIWEGQEKKVEVV
ncbi:MAG: class II SORL domain-containing protein [Candidatus Odinarchaeia archaeon]